MASIQKIGGVENDLQTATDLNTAFYDCFFEDRVTANAPDFGRPENGPVTYKGNSKNGVQYAFATGDKNNSNGFAWRVIEVGQWGNWHIVRG